MGGNKTGGGASEVLPLQKGTGGGKSFSHPDLILSKRVHKIKLENHIKIYYFCNMNEIRL